MSLTSNPNDPRLHQVRSDGQNEVYLVLSGEERAKGFTRPVRRSYVHVGPQGPQFPLRDLSDKDIKFFGDEGFVKFESYPEGYRASTGRFWSQADLDSVGNGCKTLTTMGYELAATYARDPKFYGMTFCTGCGKHLPVAEFVWNGTTERVGS